MSYIGRDINNLSDRAKLDSISTSATATFNLLLNSVAYVPSSAESLTVSLNGVIQAPQSSYTVSGSTIIFASNLASSDVIDFILAERAITLSTIGSGTVTTSNIVDDAVTVGKISIPDNAKLNIGTGTDLEIYHDGTNSLIDNNTGKLLLQSGSEIVVNENSVDCDFRIESNSNENLFVTNGDEGKIGMGTANPITNGAVYIDFSGGSGTGGSLLTLRAGGSTNSQNIIATTHTGVTDKSTTITTQRESDGSVDMLFATAGTSSTVGSADMTINGDNSVISGDFNDTSDVALKENILDIPDGAITTIKALRPRTFTWITSKDEGCDKDSGFIAQEVETVLEDDVHGEDGAKGINTLGVVAHLTKALQESIAKIEALEDRVTELENA